MKVSSRSRPGLKKAVGNYRKASISHTNTIIVNQREIWQCQWWPVAECINAKKFRSRSLGYLRLKFPKTEVRERVAATVVRQLSK